MMIECEFIKNKRAKRCRIRIDKKGNVIVVVPNVIFGRKIAERFLHDNLTWIEKKLRQLSSEVTLLPDSSLDYINVKKQALGIVCEKLKKFNEFYKFSYNQVSIKRNSSRWGSCSSKKNLNFNYKLIHLKQEVRDYIVVHELCHLKEMNHSKKFWDLVGLAIPNYKSLKKELKRFRA
mgnify:CR=1 FL=1